MGKTIFDIPNFTISGVLPPFIGGTPVVLAAMSPYPTTLTGIANNLCASKERQEIFRGLLNYREQLSSLGLNSGFQWLSGSFLEDIETLEARHPRDVDLVTFCRRPKESCDDEAWELFVKTNIQLLTKVKCEAPVQLRRLFRGSTHSTRKPCRSNALLVWAVFA